MNLPPNKKIYFAADQHFGIPDAAKSKVREKKFVAWLDLVQKDAAVIFLLGDLFDFWFEYKKVVPKGYVRILGKLAEIRDSGIPVYFFVGNHDLWMEDYFEQELGIPVFREPKKFTFEKRDFLIGHGDGLGPGDGHRDHVEERVERDHDREPHEAVDDRVVDPGVGSCLHLPCPYHSEMLLSRRASRLNTMISTKLITALNRPTAVPKPKLFSCRPRR